MYMRKLNNLCWKGILQMLTLNYILVKVNKIEFELQVLLLFKQYNIVDFAKELSQIGIHSM